MFSYGIGIKKLGDPLIAKNVLEKAKSMGYKSQVLEFDFGLVLQTEDEMKPEHADQIKEVDGVAEIAPVEYVTKK